MHDMLLTHRATIFIAVVAVACTSCCSATSPDTHLFTGTPTTYLLRLQQFPWPGFTTAAEAHSVPLDDLSTTTTSQTRLRNAGFQAAASVRYFRDVPTLSTANGPIDVISTVSRFASLGGASSALDEEDRQSTRPPAQAISVGDLGDEARGVEQAATAADGVEAVQITVQWRHANLLNIVVVRGRLGGARLNDALTIAQRQQSVQSTPA